MAAKAWKVIKVKYPNLPWVEYARTKVPAMVEVYVQNAKMENPSAQVSTFTESK